MSKVYDEHVNSSEIIAFDRAKAIPIFKAAASSFGPACTREGGSERQHRAGTAGRRFALKDRVVHMYICLSFFGPNHKY